MFTDVQSMHSTATRSPALASPGIPAHPGTSASPPITLATSAPTSHPRLLTGKLSTLASGSGSGSTPPPASATWGRPGLATGAPTGSAFGKGGFVPAAPVGGAGPPGSAGPRLGGPPGPHQALGRMRGAFGQQSRAGHAPWAGAGRNNAGFSRGGSLDQDFPSFQEAARGESRLLAVEDLCLTPNGSQRKSNVNMHSLPKNVRRRWQLLLKQRTISVYWRDSKASLANIHRAPRIGMRL